MIPDSARLEDPELVVASRGQIAGPGERGWGVPERNIPVRFALCVTTLLNLTKMSLKSDRA